MAVLPDADRVTLWSTLMTESSRTHTSLAGVTKAELRAAINAADDWADANAASYNTALPQPARGALTAKQKAAILLYVIKRRYEVA